MLARAVIRAYIEQTGDPERSFYGPIGSQVGPGLFAAMNEGTVFVAPYSVASATCGFCTEFVLLAGPGLLPPTAV